MKTMMAMACGLMFGSSVLAGSASLCVTETNRPISTGVDAVESFTFVVGAGAVVTDVAVDLEIDHTWLGDLVIEIEHDGVVVTLIDRVNDELFPFGCGGRDMNASFRDDASVVAGDLCVPTTPAPQPEPMLVGHLIPEEALSAFDGMDANGVWTIRVMDEGANDSGVLRSACVTIGHETPACAGDVDGSGAVDVDDLNALLSAWGTDVGVGSALDLANDDGVIDVDDLNVVLGAWGVRC